MYDAIVVGARSAGSPVAMLLAASALLRRTPIGATLCAPPRSSLARPVPSQEQP